MSGNIRVTFTDGSVMIYEPQNGVRIANRGPKSSPYKDFEKISNHPPAWTGFNNFEARILAPGHRVQTHKGLLTVATVEHDVDASPGDPAVMRTR